ncbi:MAG: type II toxin-antitoxin system VapC family toxin [Novosphingobium sp.]|nr:type II toxin-antitoxin system VapC family toxin [Novosphingobium sp.]
MASSDGPILLDTHVIVWMATGDPRLRRINRQALADPGRPLVVSAIVAFELADLQMRGRIAMSEPIDFLQQNMEFAIVDLPGNCWQLAAELPAIHRDPVDRMLIAHALTSGMALATADANIRRYPVPVL